MGWEHLILSTAQIRKLWSRFARGFLETCNAVNWPLYRINPWILSTSVFHSPPSPSTDVEKKKSEGAQARRPRAAISVIGYLIPNPRSSLDSCQYTKGPRRAGRDTSNWRLCRGYFSPTFALRTRAMPMALLQLHDMDYVELQEVKREPKWPGQRDWSACKALHIEGIVELPLQGDHRLRVRCSALSDPFRQPHLRVSNCSPLSSRRRLCLGKHT